MEKSSRILNELARSDGFLSAAQIAEAVELPRSSVYRLLDELGSLGLVRKTGDGHFGMGPRLLLWGEAAASSFDLRQAAEAPMRRLRDKLHESVHLYVREAAHRICIAAVEGNYGLRRFVRIGEPLPLRVGAAGKLLLAFAGEEVVAEEVARAREDAADGAYPNAPGPDGLLAELRDIRRDPWAMSFDEREAGVAAVAAPVTGRGAVVAALCVSGPSSRFTLELLRSWRPDIEQAVGEIAAAYAVDLADDG